MFSRRALTRSVEPAGLINSQVSNAVLTEASGHAARTVDPTPVTTLSDVETATDIGTPAGSPGADSSGIPLVTAPGTASAGREAARVVSGQPVLDVVIPVFNEQADLEPCVRRLHAYLSATFPFAFRITVADNASTDDTLAIAGRLQSQLPEVIAVHLDEKGRGRALRQVWSTSDAAVLAYMDVDLSTDLAALLPLVAPLLSGHSDLAIGTRLSRSSRVVRGPKREVISRSYNFILRRTLAARFSDAQCGFKAIRRDVARQLLPMVQDTAWFFDTELLVLAERAGLRIAEVPVDWIDDPDSRVDIVSTAVADLKGVVRIGRALANGSLPVAAVRAELGRAPLGGADAARLGVPAGLFGHAVRFALVGLLSTAGYLALFLLLRDAMGAQPANVVALLSTAVVNTTANRRLTFGLSGRGRWRAQAQGLGVFVLALLLTSGALAILFASAGRTSTSAEVLVLVIANAGATVARFAVFRRWARHA